MATNKFLLGACFYLGVVLVSQAQTNRYMVFFKDKNGTPYSTSNPSAFLSQRAIERRIKNDVAVGDRDLPVNPGYIQGVRSTGAKTFFPTKWYNGVLIQCSPDLIASIQALPYVQQVDYVAPNAKLSGGRARFNLRARKANTGVQTSNQLNQIGINTMHAAGNYGDGVLIAVLDAGFPGVNTTAPFSKLFTGNQIKQTRDYVGNTSSVYQYDDHGTNVLSVIAAQVADEFIGGAPEADFLLYVTEEDGPEYRVEEYNWTFAAEAADSAGADIINSSLGYYDFDDTSMNYTKAQMDGQTTVITRAAQWASDRGIVVVCSAGNEGTLAWKIITAPADGRDVLAVGAVDANGVRSSVSSIGPSADGRIKPDVSAMGVSVKVINSSGAITSATGTSVATPLVTSLIAGLRERFPTKTSKELVTLTRELGSLAANPDNQLGYGIPNFNRVVGAEDMPTHRFEIYPNPLSDTLVISPSTLLSDLHCKIDLINADGRILSTVNHTFSQGTPSHFTDVSALARGVYFLRLAIDNQKLVYRLVKE